MESVIKKFNRRHIRYLLIGGQAIRLEGMPRFSMDWDFYIPPHDEGNLQAINAVLGTELDTPLLPLGPRGENFVQTYQLLAGIIQFHLGGPGLTPFDEAEQRRVQHRLEGGTPVWCLSGNDLLKSKKAANRPQDQNDLVFLMEKYPFHVI